MSTTGQALQESGVRTSFEASLVVGAQLPAKLRLRVRDFARYSQILLDGDPRGEDGPELDAICHRINVSPAKLRADLDFARKVVAIRMHKGEAVEADGAVNETRARMTAAREKLESVQRGRPPVSAPASVRLTHQESIQAAENELDKATTAHRAAVDRAKAARITLESAGDLERTAWRVLGLPKQLAPSLSAGNVSEAEAYVRDAVLDDLPPAVFYAGRSDDLIGMRLRRAGYAQWPGGDIWNLVTL